jgi:hypothetical protein
MQQASEQTNKSLNKPKRWYRFTDKRTNESKLFCGESIERAYNHLGINEPELYKLDITLRDPRKFVTLGNKSVEL